MNKHNKISIDVTEPVVCSYDDNYLVGTVTVTTGDEKATCEYNYNIDTDEVDFHNYTEPERITDVSYETNLPELINENLEDIYELVGEECEVFLEEKDLDNEIGKIEEKVANNIDADEKEEKDPETIYQEFRENETDGTYLDFAHEYVANNSDFEHWVYSEYSEALEQAENGNCPDYLDGYLIIDEDGAHFNLYPDDIVDEFIQREFSIKALQNLDSDKPHYTGFEKYVAENYVPENKEKDEEER